MIYVVLAAGGSERMGFDKVTTPLAGRAPLARIAATLGKRSTIVVTRLELRAACVQAAPHASVLINPTPERGMSSSLKVANGAIAADATIGVLLADKPFLHEATLAALESELASRPRDVLYPVDDGGVSGHPVYFGPRARARLAELPDGDTLAQLRNEASLTRGAVLCRDEGAFADVDSPDAWRAAEERLVKEDP